MIASNPENLHSNENIENMLNLLKDFGLEFFQEIIEFHGVDLMKELIKIMEYKFLPANEILFQKKEIANYCYVILEGKIGCYMNDIKVIQRRLKRQIRRKKKTTLDLENKMRNITEISEYSKGEMIAEFAILTDGLEKHALTSISKEDCYFLSFEKNSYRNVVCTFLFIFEKLLK